MDLTKLVNRKKLEKGPEFRQPGAWNGLEHAIENEGKIQLAKLFGVNIRDCGYKHYRFEACTSRSRLYSKDDIAKILVDNSLVYTMNEGLAEAENLINRGIGDAKFVQYQDKDGTKVKYELYFAESRALTSDDISPG